jgi:hypothetical protein
MNDEWMSPKPQLLGEEYVYVPTLVPVCIHVRMSACACAYGKWAIILNHPDRLILLFQREM